MEMKAYTGAMKSYTERSKIKSKNLFQALSFFTIFFVVSMLWYMFYEGWDFLKSMFFIVQTITTVGYGYPKPTTDLSRMFTVGVITVGVVMIWAGLNHLVVKYVLEKQMASERKVDYKKKIIIAIVRLVSLNLLGSFFFMSDQGFTFWKAIYFAVETTATVGYGDIKFRPGIEIFLIFYMIVAAALFSYGMNYFEYLKREEDSKATEKAHKLEQLLLLQNLDFLTKLNNGRGVGKYEMLMVILQHTKTINYQSDVEPWVKVFDRLDYDSSGLLDISQLEQLSLEEKDRSQDALRVLRRVEAEELEATSVKAVLIELLCDYRTSGLDWIRYFTTPIIVSVEIIRYSCYGSRGSSDSASPSSPASRLHHRAINGLKASLGHFSTSARKGHQRTRTESPLALSPMDLEMAQRGHTGETEEYNDDDDNGDDERERLSPIRTIRDVSAPSSSFKSTISLSSHHSHHSAISSSMTIMSNMANTPRKGTVKDDDIIDIEASALDNYGGDAMNPLVQQSNESENGASGVACPVDRSTPKNG